MLYRVLGPLEVRDGEESLPLAGAKQRALLALLLLHANRVLSRDRLIDELWGDEPPATAVTSLQVYVSRLRKLLPAETLLTRPPGYLLEVEPEELDLQRFERLLADGHEALAKGDAERAAHVLHDALQLWRGPALAEFAFEPFAQAEIGRLEDLRLAAVEERIEADLALGRHAEVIGELEALVAENPHRERLRGQLILALYRSGRQAEALDGYQEARRALDELGIEPSAALRRLEKRILTQNKTLDLPPPRRRPEPSVPGEPAPPPAPLEHKLVTVLFADLTLTDEEEQDPESAGAFLDRLHSEAAAEIEAAGGTVEKGIAGALLATFGAPSARQQDHAVRAVSAALATRNRLSDVFGDELSLRMGVESGEVILQPGEIIVGERAATASAGAFELEQRNGAYALLAPLAPTRSPAQLARRSRRRRLLLLAAAFVMVVAIATIVVYATREKPITVPPNSVGVIDPKTNKVIGHIGVGSRPEAVVVSPESLWVANLDDRTLSQIDPQKRTVERRIALDATPTGLAFGFGAVWVAHGLLGTVSRIAPQYNGVATIHAPFVRFAGPSRGSIAVGDGSVWVAFGDSSVSRIDPASRRVVATTYAGNGPSAAAYGLGSLWIANKQDSSVTRINPATNLRYLGRDDTVGLAPSGITVGFDAVWVTDTGDNRVSRIEADSSSVISVPVGRAPVGIAHGLGSVWVANSGDGTVSRIDPATRKVLATIRVGSSPQGIAVGAGRVWVTVQATPRSS